MYNLHATNKLQDGGTRFATQPHTSFVVSVSRVEAANMPCGSSGTRLHRLSSQEHLLHRNVQRFRGGLVFKAHRLCVSLNSSLESHKEVGWDSHTTRGGALVLRKDPAECYRGTSLIRNSTPP